MLNYKLKTLPNGLRLITAPLANTKAMTVLFLVGAGSRYEPQKLNGISHFLEHMFFKGTQKRPTTLDIAKELDGVGAAYNAFTSEEHTGFFVRAASEHFDLALDVLFDMLYGSKFAQAEIEREKGVISEEINMYQDSPQSYITEVAKKLFYGDTALGRQVTGERATIQKFSQKDFLFWRNKFYTPDNMVAVVAGGPVSPTASRGGRNKDNWQEKISELFEKIVARREGSYEAAHETQEKPGVSVFYKKTDQAHLILGFRSIPRTDKRRPVLKVLNNLFGENMSSRLFTEVRERRGLAYYVDSEIADFQDAGVFAAAAGVDINRAEEAIKVILGEFQKLKKEKILDKELIRAKENLKGRLYLGLEESLAVAEFFAEQELFWGKIELPEEIIKKYEKVEAVDIARFSQDYFRPKNLNLALIGPFKDEENFEKILNNFK